MQTILFILKENKRIGFVAVALYDIVEYEI